MKRLTYLKSKILLILLGAMFTWNIQSRAQCTVDFEVNRTTGCAPTVIKFIAVNTSPADQITWNIGNETIRDRDTVVKIYLQSTILDVSLKVKTPEGKTCTVSKDDFIRIGSTPDEVHFSASKRTLCNGPEKVTFQGQDNSVIRWDWVIHGTRYDDAGATIVHDFDAPGEKTVSIRIEDSLGCQATEKYPDYIKILPKPSLRISASQQKGFTPFKVGFQNISNIPDQNITSQNWQFFNASPSSSSRTNPAGIKYNNEGKHDVKLTFTTGNNCTYIKTFSNYIQAGDSLDLRFSSDKQSVCPGEKLHLTNHSSGPGNFSWNLNGGKVHKNYPGGSADVSFPEAGTYDIILQYAIYGNIQTKIRKDYITVKPLKADFTASHQCNCAVPDTIQFINRSVTPNKGRTYYEWTFFAPDGETILGRSFKKDPSFKYASYGKYDVQLVVINSNGCSDTAYKEDFINLQKFKSNLDFSFHTIGVDQNLQLKFPEEHFCAKDTLKVVWLIYKKENYGKNLIKISKQKNPVINFADSGSYEVQLKVQSDQGCQASSGSSGGNNNNNNHNNNNKQGKGKVKVVKPDLDFSSTHIFGCTGDSFTFSEKTSPEILDFDHEWILTHTKDSTIRYTGSGGTHTFNVSEPGSYHVTYLASIDTCCYYKKEKKDYLKVSGLKAGFKVNPTNYCLPYHGQLSSGILVNKHFVKESGKVTYRWSATPTENVTFSDPTAANPQITIDKKGCYTVRLAVTNSEGCTRVITKKDFICTSVEAGFDVPAHVCYEDSIKVKNTSRYNADKFQWKALTSGITLLSSSTNKDPGIHLTEEGTQKMQLIAQSDHGCSDTISKTFTVERVRANFSSEDTLNYCAPAFVSFEITNANANTFYWNFGDQKKIKTHSKNAGHIYNANSGTRGTGFDVTLLAKNQYGCKAKVTKKEFITVIGPVPDFEPSVKKGCEPLEVTFKNKSQNYVYLYFDYDDSSNAIINKILPHKYYNGSSGKKSIEFKPYVVLKDRRGCYAIKRMKDPIKVFNQPEAKFTTDTTEGCEPLRVHFRDQSNFSTSWKWDFDSDGHTDSRKRNPAQNFSDGNHSVKLTAINEAGCSDSFNAKDLLTVYNKPEAAFSASPMHLCAGDTTYFKNQTNSKNKITSWLWDFEKKNSMNKGLKQKTPPPQVYKYSGWFGVTLEVENSYGCKDTANHPRFIHVYEKIREQPRIARVSYINNRKLDVKWEHSDFPRFKSYHLFSKNANINSQFPNIATYDQREDTGYTQKMNKQEASSLPPLFKLIIEDQCGYHSPESNIHQPISLTVRPHKTYANELSWTAYYGWKRVNTYYIYRSSKNKPEVLVGKVSGNKTYFIDNDICNEEFCYRVVAFHPNGKYSSSSQQRCSSPNVQDLSITPTVKRTTVKNNKYNFTEWTQPEGMDVEEYVIDRYKEGAGWYYNYHTTNKTQFSDHNAQVNFHSYQYRVRIKDHCGNSGEKSNPGTSILLKARNSNDWIKLNWNLYQGWEAGIQKQVLQYRDNNNDFATLGELHGEKTSYTDRDMHTELNGSYCYRIKVISKNGKDTSISNESCVILPSRIYIPNAFSPNNDGLNESFEIVSNSLYQKTGNALRDFKLSIYNRWGEEIFSSRDPENGWNGKTNGMDAPAGTYLYRVYAVGKDSKRYYLNGEIKLIR